MGMFISAILKINKKINYFLHYQKNSLYLQSQKGTSSLET